MNETITEILERSRTLRKHQTQAEQKLWKYIRKKQFHGLRFLRQYPIKFTFKQNINYFIADFYCNKKKLIIELDGEIHEFQKEYDNMREHVLKGMGFKILRFKNSEVKNDIDQVLAIIYTSVVYNVDTIKPVIASALSDNERTRRNPVHRRRDCDVSIRFPPHRRGTHVTRNDSKNRKQR